MSVVFDFGQSLSVQWYSIGYLLSSAGIANVWILKLESKMNLLVFSRLLEEPSSFVSPWKKAHEDPYRSALGLLLSRCGD